jgi:serine/threonine protein kinase
MEELKVLQ